MHHSSVAVLSETCRKNNPSSKHESEQRSPHLLEAAVSNAVSASRAVLLLSALHE